MLLFSQANQKPLAYGSAYKGKSASPPHELFLRSVAPLAPCNDGKEDCYGLGLARSLACFFLALNACNYAFHIGDAEFDSIFARIKQARLAAYGSAPWSLDDGKFTGMVIAASISKT